MSGIEQDIVAVGLDLKPETLLKAYSNGVFPWPTPGYPMLWYCPRKRGILNFSELHIGKRLHQHLKKQNWTFTINRAFPQVIENCSLRKICEGTWITDEMKDAYKNLHKLGHAHSVEVWEKNELIGGLYGVDVAGTFAGESMFHRKDNASKAAVLFIAHLLQKLGRAFIDIQMTTPHMETFGAKEITRHRFLKLIAEVQQNPITEFSELPPKKIWRYHSTIAGNFIEGET